MAIVFAFWQMPEEEAEFLDFIEKTGPVVAYRNRGTDTPEELGPFPIRTILERYPQENLDLALGIHENEVMIKGCHKGGIHFFSADMMQSCLIGYGRPRLRNSNELGRSGLCAYSGAFREEVFFKKPDWFLKWVRKVMNRARKRATEKFVLYGYPYPATPLVIQEAEAGRVVPSL